MLSGFVDRVVLPPESPDNETTSRTSGEWLGKEEVEGTPLPIQWCVSGSSKEKELKGPLRAPKGARMPVSATAVQLRRSTQGEQGK